MPAPKGNDNAVGNDGGAPVGNNNAVGNSGGGPPEGNTNAVRHGLHVQENRFYQDVMDDELRGLCDGIYEYYINLFNRKRGHSPGPGVEARLFEISVNHIKVIYADNWTYDRPEEAESPNPMVDKDVTHKSAGDSTVRETSYKPSPVVEGQQSLRREDRAWLKDYGLLSDPESQKADSLNALASSL